MEFDRSRLMNNITTLIKEKNIKIGELENSVGISTGYLSKMAKPENESMPGIDLIWKLAEKLGVSVDMLVGGDFSKSNDNLFYLVKFLHELKLETDVHEITWSKFSGYDAVKDPLDLPEWDDLECNVEEKIVTSNITDRYVSLFDSQRNLKATKENFYAFVDTLHIVLLFKCIETVENEEKVVYELYSATDNGPSDNYIIPLCSTLEKDGALFFALSDFYECVQRHDKDIQLRESARKAIGDFLNRNNTEELPFN